MSGKRNLTIQLDEDLVRSAKVLAAERGTSVSGLVTQQLELLVENAARYAEARQNALEAMETGGGDSGGRGWTREELHRR